MVRKLAHLRQHDEVEPSQPVRSVASEGSIYYARMSYSSGKPEEESPPAESDPDLSEKMRMPNHAIDVFMRISTKEKEK